MMENKGKIVQVSGPVVDVEFSDGNLPAIKDALYVVNNEKYDKDKVSLYDVVWSAMIGISKKNLDKHGTTNIEKH